jgi:ABC-type phosphate transport system permease subunit
MAFPAVSGDRQAHQIDVAESLRCGAVDKPAQARRHKKEMLRYLILVCALVAVILLISIALYYTQGNSVTIEHAGWHAAHGVVRA